MQFIKYEDLESLACKNLKENLWLSDIHKKTMKKLVKEFNETTHEKNIDNLIFFIKEKKNSEIKLHQNFENYYLVDIWIKALN